MLENPNDSTIPVSASVKRYAPPNQRNHGLSRRKSGGIDGDKNQAASKNITITDQGDAGSSKFYPQGVLIPLDGCSNSEAAQLLNTRWEAAMHAFNDPPLDLTERPVMYSGTGASTWGQGQARPPQQMDFLAELRRAIRANASA
ncbi:hypothetical protein C5167_015177 [Papaver somniferum]|uniref:Uncharacterized protein n=1 Tax=Papaver somniferum TaxID=3469 RepID=A0A4Y7J5A3_PAPSO|nr:uncharacterized protein LOC113358236 [Papaver somniferum]RZC56323.1 hypothetical protein C5167_015177 [Papaver somniferum]